MLGPVRVRVGADWVPVRAAQQRALLAALLVDAGQTVTTERLVDEVWGDRPPRTAHQTVHAYVMRLRRLLGDAGVVATRDRGYQLVAGAGDIDAWEFERLVGAGRRALAGGRPDVAADRLAEALALWAGPVLADVPERVSRAARVAQLDQARLGATEDHLLALLELDRHGEAVDRLHRLVEEHPLREQLWVLLVRAQRAAGRRADALATYRRARGVLRDELGLEPGEALQQVQREILGPPATATAPANAPPVAPTTAPATAPPVPAVTVPAQLPADVAAFTGRDDVVDELDGMLSEAAPVIALTGMAGVGKSALAVHWAHRVRCRYPDGQLHVNLRGYGSSPPLRPVDVLARFLPALGVPAEKVPLDEEAAAALFRTRLADRRMLVLLDNAVRADQVRPLLPGGPGCLVVVTNRHRLTSLVARDGAVALDLAALSPAGAHALLVRLLGAARTGAEPAATAALARLCAYLPLALRIAAAQLTARPAQAIGAHAAGLDTGDRLAALEVDEDPQAAVRVAFDQSYAVTEPGARRLFRLLGLVPGPDVTVPAAAALAGRPVAETVRCLDRLVRVHLVEEPRPGRYALHDLLRDYAAGKAAAEDGDRDEALGRLHEHYLAGVDAAGGRLYPQLLRIAEPPPVDDRFSFDDADALAWLDSERENLVAAVQKAATEGPYRTAWLLAHAMRGYLYTRMHTVDWQSTTRAAMAAARADDDPQGEATAHLSAGTLHWAQDRYGCAIDSFTRALDLARRAGWRDGEAAALANIGRSHHALGDLDAAADHFVRALEFDCRSGRIAGQATKLATLGTLALQRGRPATAARLQARAVALHRQLGARNAEAGTLTTLGWAYHTLGRLDAARTALDTPAAYTGSSATGAARAWRRPRSRPGTATPASTPPRWR